LAARRPNHDSGGNPRPRHGSRKHRQVSWRRAPTSRGAGSLALYRTQLVGRPLSGTRADGKPLGGSRGAWGASLGLGSPGCVPGAGDPAAPSGQASLTALARPQDAGRRESAARAAAVGPAPGLPHRRRLRVRQSPECVSVDAAPGVGNRGLGRRRRRRHPGLATSPSRPPPRPRRDPDNVTFCVLAADEEDEGDIALQIHFTLIQAFCCENDIDIVRVGDVQRLAAIVGAGDEAAASGDLHCILISNPNEDAWKDPALEKLSLFCEESRSVNDWVPSITLPE
uniref:Ribosomal protein eL8/eL30/eS12/Gadd45 domain-containing protein n=1 Tax=Suricata suricatta TaxID=37032 RepID=A0A673VIV1_SURSU